MMEFESNPSKPVEKWGLCMSSPKTLLLLLVGTFDAAQGREHIHHAQCNNNTQNFGFWHRQEEAQCNKLQKKAAATLQMKRGELSPRNHQQWCCCSSKGSMCSLNPKLLNCAKSTLVL
jgi:hypothetical protein